MKTYGPSDTWRVRLKTGNDVMIMADMHEETAHNHIFSFLLETTEEERQSEHLHITNTFPTFPERVVATVAAFALDDVVDVVAGDWKEIPVT